MARSVYPASAGVSALTAAGVLLALVSAGCEKIGSVADKGASPMKRTITSSQLADGKQIPARYTADGADISPPLAWTDPPAGTKELALIMDDPDAPRPEPWVHWLIYKIPPDVSQLAEGIATAAEVSDPAGAVQGKNSWPAIGYRGPAPPPGHGVHHYYFKLYALDAELGLQASADKKTLLKAMEGHILAEGQLVCTYHR